MYFKIYGQTIAHYEMVSYSRTDWDILISHLNFCNGNNASTNST